MSWRQTVLSPTRVRRVSRRASIVCACVVSALGVISATPAAAFDDRKPVQPIADGEATLGTFHLGGPDRITAADGVVPSKQARRRAPSPLVRDGRSYSTADVLHMFADARAALEDGDRGEARRLFEGVVAARPDSELADTARKELATLNQDYRHPAQPPTEHRRERDASRSSESVYGPKRPRKKPTLSGRQERKQRSRRLVMLERQFIADVGDRIFFAQNSAVLDARARAVLVAQADWLKEHPDIVITIEGHGDTGAGVDAASNNLSLARAEAVRLILTDEGISEARIASVGRGAADPVAMCSGAQCAAQNRRVVTVISSDPIRVVGDRDPRFGPRWGNGFGHPERRRQPPSSPNR